MKNRDDVFVMYLIEKESLNMSGGKGRSQVGHAVMQLVDIYHYIKCFDVIDNPTAQFNFHKYCFTNKKNYEEWRKEPTKIVLKANDIQWEELKKLPCTVVIDGGYTEVPPNSETVLGFWPMKKSEAPELIKNLKLL